MSHHVTKRVRKHSKQKGSAFNVLLSIAEHAQAADGFSHPGNRLIAEESHVSERQVERIVRSLARSGDVYMKVGRGRGRYTRYLVTAGLDSEVIAKGLIEQFGFRTSRASIAAKAILKRQSIFASRKRTRTKKATELTEENPTLVSPLTQTENPTELAGKPDTLTIKPDIIAGKPDTLSEPYKEVLEPSEPIEPKEPFIAATPAATQPAESPPNGKEPPELFEFLGYYKRRFVEQFDEQPTITRGKDHRLVNELLKTYGLAKLKQFLEAFFASEDGFILDAGCSIGVFHSQINKLISGRGARASPQFGPKTQGNVASLQAFARKGLTK